MDLAEFVNFCTDEINRLSEKFGFIDYDFEINFIHYRDRKIIIPPDFIIDFLCKEYGIDKDILLSPKRDDETVAVRQLIHYFLNEYCSISMAEIGRLTRRSRSDVLYSLKEVKNQCEIYPEYYRDLQYVESAMLEHYRRITKKFPKTSITS